MKHLIFILSFFPWAGILSAQALTNPGFEQPDASGWVTNRTTNIGSDADQPYAGQASMRIGGSKGEGFGAFSQVVQLPVAASHRKFRVSGHIRRDSVTGFVGIWIKATDGKNSLFFDNMYDRQLKGTAPWATFSTDFVVDESARDVQIGGLLVGAGTAWFDDFNISEIPMVTEALPDSLRTFLDEALDIVQKNALFRDSVSWPKVRQHVATMAAGATSYAECYPAVRYVLAQLGDHHSFHMGAQTSRSWAEPEPESYKKMPLASGEIQNNKYAVVRMPGVSSGSEEASTYFADQLQNLIETLARSKPHGWILDLRGNTGGNCWPMLAGIGPLLGDGTCGHFVMPGKETTEPWMYAKGVAGIGKNAITQVSRKPVKLGKKLPNVAVLTGPRTASSGEVVTVAFRKRPNTRSFGEPTAGLSTGNQNFHLLDGSQIFLTTSIYADREKQRYGSKILPDEQVAQSSGDTQDAALEAAKVWLRKVCEEQSK